MENRISNQPEDSFLKELKKSSPLLKFSYGLISVPPVLALFKVGYDLLRYQELSKLGENMAGIAFLSVLAGFTLFIGCLPSLNGKK